MKKVLFIGYNDPGEKNNIHTIQAELNKRFGEDIKAGIAYWEELYFEINKDRQLIVDSDGKDISDYDLVICVNWYRNGAQGPSRDLAYATALYLDKKNTPFWNQEMLKQRSTTKLSAMMQLAIAGLDVPDTLFSLDAKLLSEKATKYPGILKDVSASRGRSNFLIKSENDKLKRFSGVKGHNTLMFQEFIPNDGDLRIVCFDSKPVLVIKRKRQNTSTHLNNTSQGGLATLMSFSELEEKAVNACKKVCDIMGRNIAGIDLLPANDGSSRQVFLEVNAIPQLSSGSFVDEKMDSLAKTIGNYLTR
jgi:glutathione synthase/RimK-type ligase-like ATP-grasp enzyme